MNRRDFVVGSSAALGLGALASRCRAADSPKDRDRGGVGRADDESDRGFDVFLLAFRGTCQVHDRAVHRHGRRDGLRRRRTARSADDARRKSRTPACRRSSGRRIDWACRFAAFPRINRFSFPTPNSGKKNIERTIASIELAYKLGIPSIRVNTGQLADASRISTS